jgi:hypothetical protein
VSRTRWSSQCQCNMATATRITPSDSSSGTMEYDPAGQFASKQGPTRCRSAAPSFRTTVQSHSSLLQFRLVVVYASDTSRHHRPPEPLGRPEVIEQQKWRSATRERGIYHILISFPSPGAWCNLGRAGSTPGSARSTVICDVVAEPCRVSVICIYGV